MKKSVNLSDVKIGGTFTWKNLLCRKMVDAALSYCVTDDDGQRLMLLNSATVEVEVPTLFGDIPPGTMFAWNDGEYVKMIPRSGTSWSAVILDRRLTDQFTFFCDSEEVEICE